MSDAKPPPAPKTPIVSAPARSPISSPKDGSPARWPITTAPGTVPTAAKRAPPPLPLSRGDRPLPPPMTPMVSEVDADWLVDEDPVEPAVQVNSPPRTPLAAEPIAALFAAPAAEPLPPAVVAPALPVAIEHGARDVPRRAIAVALGFVLAGAVGFAAGYGARAPSASSPSVTLLSTACPDVAKPIAPEPTASSVTQVTAAPEAPPLAAIEAVAPSVALPSVPASPSTAESPIGPAAGDPAVTRASTAPVAAGKRAATTPSPDPAEGHATTPAVVKPTSTDVAIAQAMAEGADRAKGCLSTGSPSGTAQVSVTFAPSGDAAGAFVRGAPFANTVEGDCMALKFRSLHVPPFTGDSVTAHRAISLP